MEEGQLYIQRAHGPLLSLEVKILFILVNLSARGTGECFYDWNLLAHSRTRHISEYGLDVSSAAIFFNPCGCQSCDACFIFYSLFLTELSAGQVGIRASRSRFLTILYQGVYRLRKGLLPVIRGPNGCSSLFFSPLRIPYHFLR